MHAGCDLLLGDWLEVLDVEPDSLICDPPFGSRTHEGHDALDEMGRATLGYLHWTPADVGAFVAYWAPRTRGWIACFTSHDLIPAWEQAFEAAGRTYFAPVGFVDFRPRLQGDGPANWLCYIMTARPRSKAWLSDWRRKRKALGLSTSLDGAYKREPGDVVWTPPGGGKRIGGKPIGLMRRLVEDYSFPGEVVCDPCAGHGTTMRAALELGRGAVGAERDREVWAQAIERLAGPIPQDMFATVPMAHTAEQQGLFGPE